MRDFFCNLDWDSFWLGILTNSIFFLLSIPVAIRVIPFFTIRQLNRKNKNFIVKKISSVIQETCEFITCSPFKDKELNREQISICTRKTDIKNYRFIALVNINVFDKVSFPKIFLVVGNYFEKLSPNESLKILEKEQSRLKEYRLKLEEIISIHSLHVDNNLISQVSNLCLDIRSFELKMDYNYAIDDLIEKGLTERKGVFGVTELGDLYRKTISLLKDLIDEKYFETEITKTSS